MVWPRPVPCPELCSVLDPVATVTSSIEQMNLNKTYRNNLAAALARIDARPQKKENSVRLLRCGRSWRQQGSDGVEGGPLLDEKPRAKPCFLEHSGLLLSFYERVVHVASLGCRWHEHGEHGSEADGGHVGQWLYLHSDSLRYCSRAPSLGEFSWIGSSLEPTVMVMGVY